MVVDVRCVQLEVRWIHPNQSMPLLSKIHPPPSVLDLGDLESGELKVYDRSRSPKFPLAEQLPHASYGPDVGYGHRVRFKDPAGAAVKYGHFHRIPRAATQGYDMNVLQVQRTLTKVEVRWQDGTTSESASIELHPYLNSDEHDVWPGERVSLKEEEEHPDGNGPGSLRARRVGVVQSVDAKGRMARVRWYLDACIDMDEERSCPISSSSYGRIGDEITDLVRNVLL